MNEILLGFCLLWINAALLWASGKARPTRIRLIAETALVCEFLTFSMIYAAHEQFCLSMLQLFAAVVCSMTAGSLYYDAFTTPQPVKRRARGTGRRYPSSSGRRNDQAQLESCLPPLPVSQCSGLH